MLVIAATKQKISFTIANKKVVKVEAQFYDCLTLKYFIFPNIHVFQTILQKTLLKRVVFE